MSNEVQTSSPSRALSSAADAPDPKSRATRGSKGARVGVVTKGRDEATVDEDGRVVGTELERPTTVDEAGLFADGLAAGMVVDKEPPTVGLLLHAAAHSATMTRRRRIFGEHIDYRPAPSVVAVGRGADTPRPVAELHRFYPGRGIPLRVVRHNANLRLLVG